MTILDPLPDNPGLLSANAPMDHRERYDRYRALVDARIPTVLERSEPRLLYDPTRYVLESGGKRIRAVLVMLACEAVGGSGEAALDAGVAVEILHNFTLVHDDIMDSAATRRGRQTVHMKWDEGTAILVGDVMIGIAYRVLRRSAPQRVLDVMDAFTRGIIDVCEGQTLDREFESRSDIGIDDYLGMIAMKTGRLVEMAAEVGGLIGGGSDGEIAALCAYARHVGQAFQIQDDLLDIMADEAALGKQIGGDVIEGKRTYLLIRALERVENREDHALLERLIAEGGLPAAEVDAVREVFRRSGALESAIEEIAGFTARAEQDLDALPPTAARDMLVWFARMVMARTH